MDLGCEWIHNSSPTNPMLAISKALPSVPQCSLNREPHSVVAMQTHRCTPHKVQQCEEGQNIINVSPLQPTPIPNPQPHPKIWGGNRKIPTPTFFL
jgi:hypothetical protein